MTQPATGAASEAGLSFAMDRVSMNVHGNADSHIDALCHVIFDGGLYNGVVPDAVTAGGTSAGALTIDLAHDGIAGVLWTAGVEAPSVAEALAKATGAERDRAKRIVVGEDLTIPGHPEISVLGDLMSHRGLPGVAEVAMQSGLYAGRRVRRQAGGAAPAKPFRYHDLGSAAYISRGRAVLSTGPLRISGFLGWIGWLFIHIAFLTGFRNRFGAILTWWAAFTRDIRRERAFTTHAVGVVWDVYHPSAAPGAPPYGDAHAHQEAAAPPGGDAQPAADARPAATE